MLWFARASVGVAGFFGKILIALKKLFSRTNIPDFRYIQLYIPVPDLCILYIFGDPCPVSKMFKKNLNFWIIALNLALNLPA